MTNGFKLTSDTHVHRKIKQVNPWSHFSSLAHNLPPDGRTSGLWTCLFLILLIGWIASRKSIFLKEGGIALCQHNGKSKTQNQY